MSRERTLRSERVYQGRLVGLRVEDVELPSGRQTRREIVEHGDVVAVVAVDSERNVLLVRQYRKAVDDVLTEIPAGNVEPGEAPLETAHRELREETGYAAGRWESWGGFFTSPGFCTEYVHLYYASELTPDELDADFDEAIEVVKIPLGEVPQIVSEVRDAKTAAGLLLAKLRLADH